MKPSYHFSLASLLLWCAAIPIWVFLIVAVRHSSLGSTGAPIAALSLILATAAIFHLFRTRANGLALAALLAGLILMGSLVLVAIVESMI